MTDAARIRVLTVDDHPLFREGIGAIVNYQADMLLAGVASSGAEALESFRTLRPDVTLMDLRLPDRNGLDVLMAIRAEVPEARIIVLTTFERDAEVRRAFQAGARGYLLKSMPVQQMVETIREVHAGRISVPAEIAAGLVEHIGDEALSDREIEVLCHVAAGSRNREIAKRLYIAEETVKVHVKRIMTKLAASDRTEAVTIAVRRGMIRL